jgi:multidrug resistance efflux pump
LRELVRQTVQRGDLIAKVFELEKVTVQAAIPEREIAGVGIGQPVAVKVRAYPNRIFRGRVTRIATTARGSAANAPAGTETAPLPGSGGATKGANTVLTMTEIDNGEGLLKPGMTGVAKIYCGERRFVDLVARRLSLTFKVEFWSWW